MSIFALGIMPYISASIIMQLLSSTVPTLEALKKRAKLVAARSLNTRYATVALALVQAVGVSMGHNWPGIAFTTGFQFHFVAVTTFVAGAVFMMWLGEQITERGIGNGISLLIFAGIIAGLPGAIGQAFEAARQGDINIIALLIIAFFAVAVIGFMYLWSAVSAMLPTTPSQQGKKMVAAQQSHLPLKINMAGVIPPTPARSCCSRPQLVSGSAVVTKASDGSVTLPCC